MHLYLYYIWSQVSRTGMALETRKEKEKKKDERKKRGGTCTHSFNVRNVVVILSEINAKCQSLLTYRNIHWILSNWQTRKYYIYARMTTTKYVYVVTCQNKYSAKLCISGWSQFHEIPCTCTINLIGSWKLNK